MRVDVPADLPPLRRTLRRCERALVNVLENALKFSPPGFGGNAARRASRRRDRAPCGGSRAGGRGRRGGEGLRAVSPCPREAAVPGLGLAIARGFIDGERWAHLGRAARVRRRVVRDRAPYGRPEPGAGVMRTLLVVDDEPRVPPHAGDQSSRRRLRGRDRNDGREAPCVRRRPVGSTPSCSISSCPTAAGRMSAERYACGAMSRSWSCPRSARSARRSRPSTRAPTTTSSKPFAISRAARASPGGAPSRRTFGRPGARVGPLEIDRDGRAVRRDGSLVHLTPHEFDLLRVLAENEGKLVRHARDPARGVGPGVPARVELPPRVRLAVAAQDRGGSSPAAATPDGAGARVPARRANPETALRARVPTVAAWRSSLRYDGCGRVASSSSRGGEPTTRSSQRRVPSPRLAWRTSELCYDRASARPGGVAHRDRASVGGAVPAQRLAAQPRRGSRPSWR